MIDFLACFNILVALNVINMESLKNNARPAINMLAIVTDVGFIVAVPLVIFMLIAIKADRYLNSAPLFMIAAIILSPVMSGIVIWQKIRAMNKLT